MGLWPLYLLLIILSLDPTKYSMCFMEESDDEFNVGTVLFEQGSLRSHCWTEEESVILSSRRTFQQLLPKMETPNIHDDQYIASLLNYFEISFENVNNKTNGKIRHLMLKSLSDVIGGYLNTYIVPVTKVSFYAGTVKYCNTKKTIELLNELKHFLHTDGGGWRKPMDLEMYINVTPIAVSNKDASSACAQLILESSEENFQRAARRRRSYRVRRKYKRRKRQSRWQRNKFADRKDNADATDSPTLFLPYLDDDIEPNSIALPFRERSLWSLYDNGSVSILSRYYETCVNCLSSKSNGMRALSLFNRRFYMWLLQSVYPHLSDKNKWYPAFGGVLKIIALLKDVVEMVNSNSVGSSESTSKGVASELEEGIGIKNAYKTSELIIFAIGTAAILWIFVGMALVCYKYLRTHSDECSPCESPKSDVALLFKNVDYCDLKTCPSLRSQRSIGEKIKVWWKNRFKTCPGGCDRTLEKEQCLASYTYSSKESTNTNTNRRTYKKRRKRRCRSVSVSASPSSSSCSHYLNRKYYCNSGMSTSESDSSYR
ncbi:hypothetical protein QAD02_008722 [Eretmocerus hayati]|uniref:Uncharacterized protein n=1 Tax=Eretmocerus hayati TaxID=131215 RepID=A0ACC2N780_9HYME|nr:hypothetical protein QAD02_008722 [Eretmocerus hayati]